MNSKNIEKKQPYFGCKAAEYFVPFIRSSKIGKTIYSD